MEFIKMHFKETMGAYGLATYLTILQWGVCSRQSGTGYQFRLLFHF